MSASILWRSRARSLQTVAILLLGIAAIAAVACSRNDEASTRDGMTSTSSGGVAIAPEPGLYAPEERALDSVASKDGGMGAPSAAPAPAMPGSGPTNFPSADQTLGRQIIRSGSMDLEVTSVADSFEAVRQIAEGAGGFVADSSFSGSKESQRAFISLRVPANQFGAVVEQLRGVASEVRSISTSAQDVTEEFADLEAQLRNLRAVERQYLELLGRANTIGDVLMVQDRLDQVRYGIERTQGRINLLESLTSMATLQVSLSPVPTTRVTEPGSGLGATARAAWEASIESLVAIATVFVAVVVYSWWLIPLLIPAVIVLRRVLRSRPARVDTQGGAA